MTDKQIIAQLKLFKSYINQDDNQVSSLSTTSASKGIIYTTEKVPDNVIGFAELLYGKDGEQWNKTFHKSFKTVMETPIETLMAQQIIHYFTTYGLESLGLYDESLVYIPHEKLEIPELEEDVPVTIIKGVTEEELKEQLTSFIMDNDIALSKDTIQCIMQLSDFISAEKTALYSLVKNRELRAALYAKYDIAPSNAVEFLRYIINKETGKTLLIKNDDMIRTIKLIDEDKLLKYLSNYMEQHNGYIKLAEIFLRYKDLFLAMKRQAGTSTAKQLNKIINKLDKLSHKYHKPIGTPLLNNLTNSKYQIDNTQLMQSLNTASIFRIIRILNCLCYRLSLNIDEPNPIMYKIRNGSVYCEDINTTQEDLDRLKRIYDIVLEYLIKNRLEPLFKGKTFYKEPYVVYTAPQSEKQFTNNVPHGSYIELPKNENLAIGICWNDLPNERVDLDLHLQNKTEQYGWHTSYRSGEIAYSGDITSAPEGATEVYYISKDIGDKSFLLTVNDYTSNDGKVPFKFVVTKSDAHTLERNHIINPNYILTQMNMSFESYNERNGINQISLGLFKATSDNMRFYFNDFNLGKSCVTQHTGVTKQSYEYLEKYSESQLTLEKLLILSGAIQKNEPYTLNMVETDIKDENGQPLFKQVKTDVDINLSLDNLTKDTIINLFNENKNMEDV